MIRHIINILISMPMVFPGVSQARDLGVHGRVYEIQENDLLSVILSRAQAEMDSGQWDKRVDEWRDKAKKQANRPRGTRLPRATETTSHLYDPSIIVSEDIKDPSGRIIRAAGSQVNPLSYVSMTRHMVFIDGDDKPQIDWMMQLTESRPSRFIVILTNGSINDLMEELDYRLYFDQHQQYVNKLAIKSLPALVYQEGNYLRIDEVSIQ